MDILAARELDFPSVTVCNLNPIKRRELAQRPEFEPLMHYTDMISDDDVLYDFYYENYDWVCEYIIQTFAAVIVLVVVVVGLCCYCCCCCF